VKEDTFVLDILVQRGTCILEHFFLASFGVVLSGRAANTFVLDKLVQHPQNRVSFLIGLIFDFFVARYMMPILFHISFNAR